MAGGVESISCVQNDRMNLFMAKEAWLEEHKPAIYWNMLQTAENVARRYQIPRDAQDRYGVQSQQRAAAAARGRALRAGDRAHRRGHGRGRPRTAAG